MKVRKYHKISSLIIALPLLIIIISGILLLTKSNFESIQPRLRDGLKKDSIPNITFNQINNIIENNPNIKNINNVSDLIYKPSKGIFMIRSKNNYEIQIDAYNGQILNEAPRYSSLIVKIHEGVWFHPLVKNWIFLPVSIILLTLWISGIQIFFSSYLKKKNFLNK